MEKIFIFIEKYWVAISPLLAGAVAIIAIVTGRESTGAWAIAIGTPLWSITIIVVSLFDKRL